MSRLLYGTRQRCSEHCPEHQDWNRDPRPSRQLQLPRAQTIPSPSQRPLEMSMTSLYRQNNVAGVTNRYFVAVHLRNAINQKLVYQSRILIPARADTLALQKNNKALHPSA